MQHDVIELCGINNTIAGSNDRAIRQINIVYLSCNTASVKFDLSISLAFCPNDLLFMANAAEALS